ncbi:MAG: hypothetical protein XD95_0211 [Microgenomates bacterium 39_7]|nr:MAG: hypothetical protein XD95_0211 [Microgenomates bacterium 39_7]
MTQIIEHLLILITDYVVGITLLIGFIGGIVKFWQWISIKNSEDKKNKFNTYHQLIKDLVEPENENKDMRRDRQIAIIYELRNYRKYFPVTTRILEDLREVWLHPKNKRLIDEIVLTLNYIRTCRLWRWSIKD